MMAGVKGKSGRHSKFDETYRLDVVHDSIRVIRAYSRRILKRLREDDISDEALRIAATSLQPFVLKTMPDRVSLLAHVQTHTQLDTTDRNLIADLLTQLLMSQRLTTKVDVLAEFESGGTPGGDEMGHLPPKSLQNLQQKSSDDDKSLQ